MGRSATGSVVRPVRRVPVTVRVAVVTVVAAAAVLLAAPARVGAVPGRAAGEDGADSRFIAVGDSILLGARSQLEARSRFLGWPSVLDMEVSRSTIVGAEILESLRPGPDDVVVIGLGANDSGDPGVFRGRAERVASTAAPAGKVLWLTIAEVRPYYAGTNDMIREIAGRYPQMSVVDWAAIAGADPSLTAGDGLHLTPAGTVAMADAIFGELFGRAEPVRAQPPQAPPPSPRAAGDQPLPDPSPPSSVPTMTAAESASDAVGDPSPSSSAPTTTAAVTSGADSSSEAVPLAADGAGPPESTGGEALGLAASTAPGNNAPLLGLMAVLVVLAAPTGVFVLRRRHGRSGRTRGATGGSGGDDGHMEGNIE